jgi:hypothetical protein
MRAQSAAPDQNAYSTVTVEPIVALLPRLSPIGWRSPKDQFKIICGAEQMEEG